MLNTRKFFVRTALLGVVMMASGCALGVDEALIDNIDGISIARDNAMDRFNGGEFPGSGGQADGGGTGGNTNGGGATTAGDPGVGNQGGKHPNSGGGNLSEGSPDVDPGKGNENRSGKSKGKNQVQD